MLTAVFIVALSTGRPFNVDVQSVGKCELNHVYDQETGKIRFSQIIVYRWANILPNPGYHVSEWFMVDREDVRQERKGAHWHITWRGKNGKTCVAVTRSFREYYSKKDPETKDRRKWPDAKRLPYFE